MSIGAEDPSFAAWLRDEAGVTEPRRIVRRDAERILVSKFEAGFAARLHESLARMPELFDRIHTSAAYQRFAATHPDSPRVAAWHETMRTLLDALALERGLTGSQAAEVLAGIDSVAALLDSVLWSTPTAGNREYSPLPGEESAYTDALHQMDATPGIFTRVYGVYDGALVENHCPGAPFARTLLDNAWTIVTARSTPP